MALFLSQLWSKCTTCLAFVELQNLMASLSYENKRGSGKKLKVHFDLPEDDDYPIDHRHKHSSSSDSSGSSSSLDSDDTDKDDNSSMDNFESKYGGYGSPVWSFQSGSITQSPPLQLMSPNYDPNRIPSSIFGPRPASPMEWSVASNESLFSLHLGNNSFSRDHIFAFNNKSGELPRLNDFVASSSNSMPTTTTITLPTVQEVSSDKKVENKERHSLSSSDTSDDETEDLAVLENDNKRTSNETGDLALKDEHGKTETTSEVVKTSAPSLDKTPDDDHHGKEAVVPSDQEPKNYTTSVSYRSVESDMSNHSFQFPM